MDTALHIPTTLDDFLATYPTASRFQGCFVVDRHPTIPRAALLIPPKATGLVRGTWNEAQEKFETLEVEGCTDFRALDRIESLLTWKRLGTHYATAPEFKEGGEEAFDEEWHWTGETYEFNPSIAWVQHFGDGYSSNWGKDYELPARAGRILTFDH